MQYGVILGLFMYVMALAVAHYWGGVLILLLITGFTVLIGRYKDWGVLAWAFAAVVNAAMWGFAYDFQHWDLTVQFLKELSTAAAWLYEGVRPYLYK